MEDIGLIFGGGGAKGAYQIGVWKYLRETNLDTKVKAVAGTSIGSLNGALFVQGDYGTAEAIWLRISNKEILQLDIPNLKELTEKAMTTILKNIKTARIPELFDIIKFAPDIVSHLGIFSRESLLDIINQNINLRIVSESQTKLFNTCCKLPFFEKEYFNINGMRPEQITSVLLATSAIPGVYEPVNIDGSLYVDGGIVDNVPIKPLYDLGFRKFIVVNLNPDRGVNYKHFPDAEFWEIAPVNHKDYFEHATLNFNAKDSLIRLAYGYFDARDVLSTIIVT